MNIIPATGCGTDSDITSNNYLSKSDTKKKEAGEESVKDMCIIASRWNYDLRWFQVMKVLYSDIALLNKGLEFGRISLSNANH